MMALSSTEDERRHADRHGNMTRGEKWREGIQEKAWGTTEDTHARAVSLQTNDQHLKHL